MDIMLGVVALYLSSDNPMRLKIADLKASAVIHIWQPWHTPCEEVNIAVSAPISVPRLFILYDVSFSVYLQ